VIECATVNDVTTTTSVRIRRSGITRHNRNSRWSMPSRMWPNPDRTNLAAAWCQRGSRRTIPGSSCNSNARSRPSGVRSRSTIVTRWASGRRPGLMAKRDRSDAIGYSIQASRNTCSHGSSLSSVSGGPVICASAVSYAWKDRSDGSDMRTATSCGTGNRVSSSYSATSRAIHTVAASRSASSARAISMKPGRRCGISMSRIAWRGTRTRKRTRCPSGFRNA